MEKKTEPNYEAMYFHIAGRTAGAIDALEASISAYEAAVGNLEAVVATVHATAANVNATITAVNAASAAFQASIGAIVGLKESMVKTIQLGEEMYASDAFRKPREAVDGDEDG